MAAWQSTVGTELAGRRRGILGLGRIGERVARIGAAFATPHLGYVARDNYRTYFTETVEDIAAYLAGKPIRVLTSQPSGR